MNNQLQGLVSEKVAWIKSVVEGAGASGIIFGNSGGKDSALAGILCKMACENTVGVMMPCETKNNYGRDLLDARALAEKFGIETIEVDLTKAKAELIGQIKGVSELAKTNIAPRLRMTTLYALAQSKNMLVCGTGNKSEIYMGYFTKWGDGACDFNPLSDLLVTQIYKLLTHLDAPQTIINKPPSAGLFEGQTDEGEMGVTYKEIDAYINGEPVSDTARQIIEQAHQKTAHKRPALTE